MSEDIDESRICRLIQCCILCEDLRGETGVGRTKWIDVTRDHTWAVLKSGSNGRESRGCPGRIMDFVAEITRRWSRKLERGEELP